MLTKRSLYFLFFGIALCFCAMTSAAQAQASRTWVSGLGDDANPCSRTAPCKTFPGAYSRTAAGGEIDALDPGGYGTISIGKSITIDGGGGTIASILAGPGAPGVTINAGAADKVIIRNVRITGNNVGTNGINFVAGQSLTLENVTIERFTQQGIEFEPVVRSFLTVADSYLIANGSPGTTGTGGIRASTTANTGGQNKITIKNTVISEGSCGVSIGLNSRLELVNTVIAGNGVGGGDFGLIANGVTAIINADYSIISSNNFGGVHATNGGLIRMANSSITNNNVNGILIDGGGTVNSYGNNRVADNVGLSAFSSPTIPQT